MPFNVRPATERRGVDIPSNIPHHIDLEANIREARTQSGLGYGIDTGSAQGGLATFYWFYLKVRNGGPWDYKKTRRRQYEDFGNFHYGVVGSAAGFSEATLLRMAGHVRAGNPGSGAAPSLLQGLMGVGGIAPFGDDENDQYWISKGIQYYRRHYEGSR